MGALLCLFSAACFGALPIFAKLAYADGVSPATLLLLRFSVAAVLLVGVLVVRPGLRAVTAHEGTARTGRISRRLVITALGLGALLIAGTLVTWPWLAHGLHLGAMAGQARTALVLLLVGFVVNGTSVSWQAVLQGAQRYGSLARISAVAAVSGAGLSVLAATHGGGLEALAALTVVNNTAKTIVLAGPPGATYRH